MKKIVSILMTVMPCLAFGADDGTFAKKTKTLDGSDFFRSRTYAGVDIGGTRLKTRARVRTYPAAAAASTLNYAEKKRAGALGVHLGRHEMQGCWMHGLEINLHAHGNKLRHAYRGVGNILIEDKVDRYGGLGMALTGGGLVLDRLLAYGKIGLDAGRFRLTRVENPGTPFAGSKRRSKVRSGLVLGGGMSFALAENLAVRVESTYRVYQCWNSKSMATAQQPGRTYIRNRFAVVTTMVGLSYRYGTSRMPKQNETGKE